jgi:hypothetical protein
LEVAESFSAVEGVKLIATLCYNMELDDNLPDRVVELFEEEAPGNVEVRTGTLESKSLQLYSKDTAYYPIEFTRPLGAKVIEQTGYAITGIRDHDSYIEVWFDPVSSLDSTEHLTVAQRAARCLDHKENDTRFEPNISDEPKKQYVDVFPEPHEQAAEDYALKQTDMERLRSEGLEIRTMSCGRERGCFNEENYRIWFQPE